MTSYARRVRNCPHKQPRWCRGADVLSRPVIASVDRLEDNPKEEESGSRRASVLSQAVELTSRGSVIAPKGWKLANEWEIGQD